MLDKNKSEIITCLKEQGEKEFYNNFIISSSIWYFSNVLGICNNRYLSELDNFKRIISQSFSIDLHDSQLVGSAKVGFSLAPKKFPQDFILDSPDSRKISDLDIAIVSKDLFMSTWDYLKYYSSNRYLNTYNIISSSVFQGFVNEKQLQFQKSEFDLPLLEQMDNCNMGLVDEFSITHPINYRIYYSWDDLERYSINGIKEIKETLKNGV